MLAKTVARNSVLTAVDIFVGLVVTLLTAGVVARRLGPEKMGYYGFALWVSTTMSAFAAHSVGVLTRRYVAEHIGRGDLATAKAIARAALLVQVVFALVLVAIGLLYVWISVPEDQRLFNALVIATIFPYLMLVVPSAVNAASEDFAANVIPGIVGTVLLPLGIVLALKFQVFGHKVGLGWELTGLAAGLLIARTADMTLRFWFARHRFPSTVSRVTIPAELRARMWKFFWQSSMLLVLDLIVWERCEVFFLKEFSSPEQVAFYSSSFSFSVMLMGLPTAFASAAGATMMVQKGREPGSVNRMASTWLRYSALLVLPLMFGMAAMSGPAIRIVFGSRYAPAIPVVALMAIMNIPKALLTPAQSLLLTLERQGFMVRWMILSACATIALDYLLIPRYGAVGAACGNGLAQILAAGGIWIYATRQEHLQLPWRALLRMTASAAAMAGVAYSFTRFMPPLPAALLGVPIGAVVYLVMLRVTGGLEAEDRTRLQNLETQLPGPIRSLYNRGVQWIVA